MIGEFGKVTNLTRVPQTINLTRSYTNPVVFAQPASFFGEEPVVVRASDVRPNQLNLFLAEPSNLNDMHNTEETVSYVVIESGSHHLTNETHLEVGTVATSATVGSLVPVRTWETVDFRASFTGKPVVLSKVQTTTGEPFLSTRQQLSTTGNFQVAIEAEEQFASQHSIETVGYLVIDSGSGTWNGIPCRD